MPEEDINDYLAQAEAGLAGVNPRAQTMARSGGRTGAMGQRMVDEQLDDNEKRRLIVAKQQEEQARVTQQQERGQYKEEQKAAKQEQAQRVRAWRALGAQTETDITTGKTTVAMHPDGLPKAKAGPIGVPENVGQAGNNAAIAASILGGGDSGVLGASGGETKAIVGQKVRNDRWQESYVAPNAKTDKRGVQYVERTDPQTGMPVKQAVGVDEKVYDEANRDAAAKQRAQEIALKSNEVKQAKLRFMPQWEPVETGYQSTLKELESVSKVFRRNPQTGKMEKVDSRTGAGSAIYSPAELAAWQQKKAEIEARHGQFKTEREKLLPTFENLQSLEAEAAEEKLQLDEDRIRRDVGLPPRDRVKELYDASPDGKATFEDVAKAELADAGVPEPTRKQVLEASDNLKQSQREQQATKDEAEGTNPLMRKIAALDLAKARIERDAATGALAPEEADRKTQLIAAQKNQTVEQVKAEATAQLEAQGREIASRFIGTGVRSQQLSGENPGNYAGIKNEINEMGSFILGNENIPEKTAQILRLANNNLDKAIEMANGDTALNLQKMKDGFDQAGIQPEARHRMIQDAAKSQAWTDKDTDNLRKLSTGDLVINPGRVFGQKDALIAEINASDATPQAKAGAVKRLDAMRSAMEGKLFRATVYADDDFEDFANAQYKAGNRDKSAILDQWAEQQKARGWVFKATDAVTEGVKTGSVGMVKTITGAGAGLSALVGADGMAQSMGQAASDMGNLIESEKEAAKLRGITGGYGITSDLTDTVVQMAPMIAGGTIAGGLKGMSAIVTRGASVYGWAAAQGYESKLADAVSIAEQQKGSALTGEEIAAVLGRTDTQVAAFLNGAQTAILAAAMPKGAERMALGVKSGSMTVSDFLRQGGMRAIRDGTLRTELKAMGKTIFADATDEALEEFSNQVLDGMISVAALDQELKLGDLLEESFKAGALGGLVGGGLPQVYRGETKADKHKQMVAALQQQTLGTPPPRMVSTALAALDPQAKAPAPGELEASRKLVGPGVEPIKTIDRLRTEHAAAIKAKDYTGAAKIDEEISRTFIEAQTAAAQDTAKAVLLTRELAGLEEQASEATWQADEALTAAKMSGDKQAIAQAEAALEQTLKTGPNVPLARAAVKLATGQGVGTLTDKELRAVGYKPGKDGNIEPMSPKELADAGLSKPLIRRGADGTAIILDEAVAQVAQTSAMAGERIALGEQAAMQAAQARFEAAEAAKKSPAPTGVPTDSLPDGQGATPGGAAPTSSTTTTNEQNPQGQVGQEASQANPPSASANPDAPGGVGGTSGSVPAAATPAARQAGSSGAAVEAGIYEAARAADPSLPEIPARVAEAFQAGEPVSVSMQKASGIDVPEGYTRQGNVWNPPAGQPMSESGQSVSVPAGLEQAAEVAEQVKTAVEASMPALKGRIIINPTGGYGGGADLVIETGVIRLNLPAIQRAIKKAGSLKAAVESLTNIVARHEAVHVVQTEAVRSMWLDAQGKGYTGSFLEFYEEFYVGLAKDLLTPEALEAARRIYGKTGGEWNFDKIPTDYQKAAEFVRMLVEAKLDGNTRQFSELFRAIKNQGAKSALAKLIAKAVEILRSMKLAPAAQAHVDQLIDLHKQLTAPAENAEAKATPAESASKAAEIAENTPEIAENPAELQGLRIETTGATARVLNGNDLLWEGPADQAQAKLAFFREAQTAPSRITGLAIKDALAKFPRLGGKLRADLEAAAEAVSETLAALPAEERQAAAEQAIADRINEIADREAERTGKKREEIIEGFRAVAGKRAAKQAASIEAAVVGTDAPEIPAGKQEKRDTPNSEMTVDVTSTFVDLDQLVGSSDPLFPGGALQPRNRSGQASQNQREEMVQNIRDKDNQHRRYIEGATTDSGRMVIAPLFGADGKHMTNEAGKPLFYVLSGNGRRNALQEAANRKVSGKVMAGFRETAAAEGIDVDGITLPVPVSIFVPKSAKEAIDLAEYSNRDAQLSVSNTEQANRDAASIEKAGILKLWETDASGDAGAASNRAFVRGFARAVGDEGIIDGRGELTDEGAKRIERAMVAMLLGPEQAPLLDILFNQSGTYGLRAILGGIASETGSLLKLAASKPDFDLSPVLADALRTAVQAKAALVAGEIRDVGEFFDQGNLFEPTDNTTPERQLARALVESRSRKAVRDILMAYRRGAEAVDTGTMSMFAEAETTREDLILKALEARPIEQVIAEVEAEFGAKADLPAKLRIGIPGIKKLDAGQRREFVAAVNAEVDRLRSGGISAEEWQKLNPDALSAKAAFFQRWIDSHTPETIASGFNRLLSQKAQAVLGSSPAPSENDFYTFPEEFQSYGMSRSSMPQIKMPDRAEFLRFLGERGVAISEEEVDPSILKPSQNEYSRNKAVRAKGLPEDRRIFISSDNYLLDGHHQWLAQWDRDTVPVVRIGLPISEAIQTMREFPKVQQSAGMEASLEEAQREFDALLEQYRKEKPTDSVMDVPTMIKTLADEHGRDLVQSVMRDVTQRRKAHEEHKESFDGIIKRIAGQHKARPMLAGLKGVPRSVFKTVTEYKGDAGLLMDVLRGSIVARTITDIEAIVAEIRSEFPSVVKFKDRFSDPLSSGYMDIMMTVEIAPGIHAEIQVHIPEMIRAKEIGHVYYDEQRVLPKGDPKASELDGIMQRLYTAALRLAMLRATIESNSEALMGSALVSKLRSVWSENTPLVPFSQFSGSLASGSQAAGTKSMSKNLVPAGKSDAFITSSDTNSGGTNQDISASTLGSSPAPDLDLFAGLEADTFGPRAKVKRNAVETLRKAPDKAKPNVAKAIAKAEGLADLDLFAAAAVSNLDAKPRKSESVPDGSAPRQPVNPLDPRLHGGHAAAGARGPRTIGADQDLFDFAGRPGAKTGSQAGQGAAPDVQGTGTRDGGSGNGSAATNPDLGGGRPGTEGSGSGQQSGQADSGNAGQRKLTERQRPEEGSPDRNFTIGKDTVLAEGGAITRIRNNIAAIDLLRTLEAEGRNATPEEKAILAKFVGWGGLPQVFDEENAIKVESGEAETRRTTADRYESYGAQYENLRTTYREQADAIDKWNTKWGDYYRQIQKLLTPDEWESARESIINAHFTSQPVIAGMWDAVRRLGFRGGNVLEPAGGVGHFFGIMPADMVGRSRQYGIEMDRISGRIMAKLYPEADIEVTPFQETTLPENSQDLVISNVPFANINVSDEYLDAQEGAPKFNLHNYFFVRALRTARPGGLVAFISTANTMDSQIAQRKWLAERADFMGAIRLPNNAFKGNANTEVVTDIIFLRKPDGSPNPMAAEPWTSTEKVQLDTGDSIEINEYFARHPEMILGRLADDGSMYGGKKEMTVHSNGDLVEQLRAAVENLPENVVGEGQAGAIERLSIDNRTAKDGAFIEEDGKIRIKGSSEPVPTKELGKVRAFMKLRDTLNDLYAMEGDPEASDAAIAAQRKALNSAYDGFKAIYKQLHESKNKSLLETDPDFYRTLGLEVPVGQSLLRKQEYRKADVFSKRVLKPQVEPTTAENIEDAVLHSFRWKGRMDAGYIGSLLGITRDEAEARLLATEFAYRDPTSGKVEHATTYLAGNVRRKLRDAEMAAKKDPAMQRNVDALKAALPEDVGWSDINFKMGSAWIPSEMYERFLAEKLFDGRFGKAKIIYNKGVGDLIGDSFIVQQGVTGYAHSIDMQWGTTRKSATEIAEALLNQRDPRVNDTIDKKTVYNAAETDKARQAAARMQDAFQEWVASSPDVQEALHRIYNESFNSHVVPKYDGSFMQLPWVASDFDLYPDKKHVVWRALQEGTLLVAHGVGGGKTIIGTAIAMEARRLGLAKKPLIVVHNATLEQFATTISRMAPTARVLVARKADLEGPKRKEFMGRVRSGDWDAVVMAHSTFDLIPDDPAWERKQINDLIKELEDAIREQGGDPEQNDLKKIKDPSVKELVKMRSRLRERMSKLQVRRTDDVLNFQELGIDAMIVDEVHRYKKQPFVTRQSNIAGIDTGFSKRGSAMQLRAKWVQAINQGRGVFTMTGTPVTNTLGESWNMVRLVRPDLLKEFGVRTFDRFVSAFGNIKQSGELRPNGQYKPVTRLSEFTNIPEWNRFWGLAADVKMGEDMEVKGRPRIKGGKALLTAVERTPQVKAIIDEISKVIDAYDRMTGKEKHENQHIPLLTYNAARMAAIDVRLINPEAKDEAGSKVNTALKNVMRLYAQTTADKGTQVIFSDSYRPLRTTKLDLSAAEFERQAVDENATDEYDDGEGFNLYHDIREKLVKAGVPRSEIAIIGEMKNDKQREALFARVNSGEVRIIMGSTETLGTGVNMQERMIAAHHLDVPWTPAGLEQRDGRVYRQGNMWAELGDGEIEIMRYGMKDTLDAALWQKLETKERMIKQAVSGKVNARVIEDDAGLLNYMEQKAALSGADGMLKFTLDEDVRNLKNEWRAHRNRQFDLQRQSGYSREAIEKADKDLPNARRVAKVVHPLVVAVPSEIEWTFEDGEALKGEDARKALDVLFKERRKKAGAIMNPEKAESMQEPIHATANGVPVLIRVGEITEDLANAANPDLRWQFTWSPRFETEGVQQVLNASPHPGSAINQIPTRAQTLSLVPDSLERAKAQAEKDLALYADEQAKPFTKSENFRKALVDQAALYRRMGLAFPESSDVYAAAIGDDWQAVLDLETAPKAAETSPRSETPANYPGRGLAPKMATLGSSPSPEAVRSYLDSNGTPADAAVRESERVSRALASNRPGNLAEGSGTYQQADLFSPNQARPGEKIAQAGKSAAARFKTRTGRDAISPDLIAGLQGDWQALAREVNAKGRASSILPDLINREIPAWNIVGTKIETPEDVHAVMLPLRSPYFESLKVMVLDGNNNVVHSQVLTVGSISESAAPMPEIFGVLARLRETTGKQHSNIIISHNHPSGDPSPSRADEAVTRRMQEVAELTGWNVIDHVITNGEKYFSFREAAVLDSVRNPEKSYTPRKDSGKTPAKGPSQAEWETVKRSKLMPMEAGTANVDTLARMLRQANPDVGYILYTTTRLRLLGVEMIPWADMLDKRKLAQKVIAGRAREGAFGYILAAPLNKRLEDLGKISRIGKDIGMLVQMSLHDVNGEFQYSGNNTMWSAHDEGIVMDQGPTLGSSPAPDSDPAQAALAAMPPIYRDVFEAVQGGASVVEVMQRFPQVSTPAAVENILNQVRSRIATAAKAAGPDGLTPAMQGEQIAGGRPDLALGANPAVAAVDQTRNESGIPGVRGFAEVNMEAREMLRADYQGTYDKLLAKARAMEQMSDVEVAASKMVIARETIAGNIDSTADRTKLAMLIHGYRDIGTETARSLAIRRDPEMSPAERHAQFIAEALFTPDPKSRARMRKKPESVESILARWMARVDAIEADMKAQGIDIRQALADFRAEQEKQAEAAAESPETSRIIDEQIRKLSQREKDVIEAIRGGSLVSAAAYITGMSNDEVKAIYTRFMGDIRNSMAEAAKRYLAGSLGSSPLDTMGGILMDLGLPPLEMIDDTVKGFVDRRGEKPKKPRKAKPAAPKAPKPEGVNLTPEQQERLDEEWQRFMDSPLSDWKAFSQEMGWLAWSQDQADAFRAKAEGIKKDWSRQKDLFTEQEAINETTGTFDLHNPLSMAEVVEAFSTARGSKMDALMEYWRMSILTGPQTHNVNILSTAMNVGFHLGPRRVIEAMANSLIRSEKGATLSEFKPMAMQIAKAWHLAARLAARSWQLDSRGGRVFDSYAQALSLQLDFTGQGAEYVPPALGGKIGKIMRSMSFRALQTADTFLKSFYAQIDVAAQAHRIAAAEEKLTGARYAARVDALMEPGSIAWLRSMDGAKYAAFQKDMAFDGLTIRQAGEKSSETPAMDIAVDGIVWLAQAARQLPVIGRVATFFLPYLVTPTNINKQAIEYTPLGGFLALADGIRSLRRRVFRGDLSKQEAADEAAKLYDKARLLQDSTNQIIGMMALMALAKLAWPDDEEELPWITGTQPYKTTRRGERDNAFAVLPPMTMRLPGGIQFSYARFEPASTSIASMTDLIVAKNRHGGFTPAAIADWSSRFKDRIKDQSFMMGVSNLFNAIEDPDRWGERLAGNILTGFVPNILRQPLREMDTKLRDQSPREEDGFFASMGKRIGYSLVPQMAPAKRDVWGDPIPANRGQVIGNRPLDMAFRVLDPTNAQVSPQAKPIDRWIYRWNLRTLDSADRIAIETVRDKISGTIPGEKKSRVFALTVQEQAQASERIGTMAREVLGDDWDKRPLDPESARQITDTFSKVKGMVLKEIRQEKLAEAMGVR